MFGFPVAFLLDGLDQWCLSIVWPYPESPRVQDNWQWQERNMVLPTKTGWQSTLKYLMRGFSKGTPCGKGEANQKATNSPSDFKGSPEGLHLTFQVLLCHGKWTTRHIWQVGKCVVMHCSQGGKIPLVLSKRLRPGGKCKTKGAMQCCNLTCQNKSMNTPVTLGHHLFCHSRGTNNR